MDNERNAIDETPVPPGHVRTSDGRIIPRDKACFRLRKDSDGTLRASDGTAYERHGGTLVRLNGKPKLTKAEKKQQKRLRVKARKHAELTGDAEGRQVPPHRSGGGDILGTP